ncbi:YjjG family noncanonical pyrimidine nucleotidase [Orenia marismortui]|uniref:Putative hydrolase of the HAD superfamily n=1 Tax=Orenia marismortui TaxID=46469 RepID=A0A4R8GQ91_9FIRM|nr:YjjG family noncanonical pyrimidine nucleotidase [Orenia marismortui]TDX45514.1 putative hydrolase of the HAD superfamily [Orenia marismortui]
MKYDLLIFDIDRTLLDFDKAEEYAIEETIGFFNINYKKSYHLENYKAINKKLWEDFEQGLISAEKLKSERFRRLSEKLNLGLDAKQFSDKYLEFLAEGAFFVDGALEILKDLYPEHKLLVITNGLSKVQHGRINKLAINDYFEEIIISEEVGIAKPNPELFEYSFTKVGHKDKDTAIIIGDSLSSDIQGGVNFGIDTCWFNPDGKSNNTELNPTYEISRLHQLKDILKVKKVS